MCNYKYCQFLLPYFSTAIFPIKIHFDCLNWSWTLPQVQFPFLSSLCQIRAKTIIFWPFFYLHFGSLFWNGLFCYGVCFKSSVYFSKDILLLYISLIKKTLLNVASATFLLVCFISLKETCEITKNVFYFTLKALFILEIKGIWGGLHAGSFSITHLT